MENHWLDYSQIKFVIMSRGRAKSMTSHVLFPYATILVPKSEESDYRKELGEGYTIETVEDNVKGLGLLRNHIVQRYPEDIIVMIDDDITHLCRVDGFSLKKITDPETIKEHILNTAQCAKDIVTCVFGFGQVADVRKYNPTEPFSLNGWVGGVIGVIGKDHFFIDNMFKVDIDFCLEILLDKRVIWKDNRLVFVQVRDRNTGGNSAFRTVEKVEAEKKRLREKWGKYIKFSKRPNGEQCTTYVKRRETYNLDD